MFLLTDKNVCKTQFFHASSALEKPYFLFSRILFIRSARLGISPVGTSTLTAICWKKQMESANSEPAKEKWKTFPFRYRISISPQHLYNISILSTFSSFGLPQVRPPEKKGGDFPREEGGHEGNKFSPSARPTCQLGRSPQFPSNNGLLVAIIGGLAWWWWEEEGGIGKL